MNKKLLLLSLFIFHCSLFIVDSFAQNATLKVCASNTATLPCKPFASNFLSYPAGTGGYRYNPNGVSGFGSLLGGVDNPSTWRWTPTHGTIGSGVFVNSKPNVEGRHVCSDQGPSNLHPGSNLNGGHCWCQVTSINGNNCPSAPWVYREPMGSDGTCGIPSNCALSCVNNMRDNTSFRSAMLAIQ